MSLVERGEGLVHQQKPRPGHQRARDRDAHAHPAREFSRIDLARSLETDACATSSMRGAASRRLIPARRSGRRTLSRTCRPRHQGRLLEHVAQVQAASTLARAMERRPVDAALARRVQVSRDPQHGAFSATRRTDHGEKLRCARQCQRDAVERQNAVRKPLAHLSHRHERRQSHLRGRPGQHLLFHEVQRVGRFVIELRRIDAGCGHGLEEGFPALVHHCADAELGCVSAIDKAALPHFLVS